MANIAKLAILVLLILTAALLSGQTGLAGRDREAAAVSRWCC